MTESKRRYLIIRLEEFWDGDSMPASVFYRRFKQVVVEALGGEDREVSEHDSHAPQNWLDEHVTPVKDDQNLCPNCLEKGDAVILVNVAPGLDRCPHCGDKWTAWELIAVNQVDDWWWEEVNRGSIE